MAIFTFEAPNGKVYDIESPEGATQDEALDYLVSNWDTLKDMPSANDAAKVNVPEEQPVAEQSEVSFTDKAYQSAKEAAQSFMDSPFESVRKRANDQSLAITKGFIGIPEFITGIADIARDGEVGKYLEDKGIDFKAAKDYLSSRQSPEEQAASKEREENPTFGGTVESMVLNPTSTINAALESLPSSYVGGRIGGAVQGVKALGKASGMIGAGAGEFIVGSGQAEEGIRQQTPDGLTTPAQSASAVGTGLADAFLAGIGSVAAKKLGIADIDTLSEGARSAEVSIRNMAKQILGGMGIEGGEELTQSAAEKIIENYALDKPSLFEGVPNASAIGMLTGAAMGGGHAFVASGKPAVGDIDTNMLQGGLPTSEAQPATAQPVDTNLDDYNNIFSDENLNRRSNAPIVDNETVAADIMVSDDPIATFNDVVEANTFGNEINMDYANKVADRFIGKKEIEISDKDYQDAVQLEHQLSTVRDEIAYRKFQEMYSQNKRDDLNDLIAQEVAEKQQQLAQILEQQRNNRVEKSIPSINKTIENEQWGKTRNNRNTVIQMVFDKNVPAENIFPAIKAELKRQGFRDTEINQDDIDAYNLLKTSPTTPVAKAPEVILSSENEMNVAGLIKEKAQPVALDQTLPALEKVNEWVNNGAKYKNGMLIDNNGKKFLLNKAQREHYANLVTPIVADDTPVATTEETPFTPTQLVDDTVFSEESVLTPQVQSAQQEKASAKEIYKNEKGDNNGEYYYGMVKEVTKIMPNELKPLSQTEINGAISSQRYSELTPEEWAKTIDLSKPIDATIYGDGEIKIQDGHHRYLAAKILNKPLSVEFRSINAKNNILNDAIYRINKGVEDYQSNNVDTSDTNPNVPLDSAQQTPELKKDGTPFAKASAANLIINSKHRTDLSNDTHKAVELPTGGFGIVAKAPTAATAKSVKNSADNLASSFPIKNWRKSFNDSSDDFMRQHDILRAVAEIPSTSDSELFEIAQKRLSLPNSSSHVYNAILSNKNASDKTKSYVNNLIEEQEKRISESLRAEENQQPTAKTSSDNVEVSRGIVEQPVEKPTENKQVDDNVSKVDEKIDNDLLQVLKRADADGIKVLYTSDIDNLIYSKLATAHRTDAFGKQTRDLSAFELTQKGREALREFKAKEAADFEKNYRKERRITSEDARTIETLIYRHHPDSSRSKLVNDFNKIRELLIAESVKDDPRSDDDVVAEFYGSSKRQDTEKQTTTSEKKSRYARSENSVAFDATFEEKKKEKLATIGEILTEANIFAPKAIQRNPLNAAKLSNAIADLMQLYIEKGVIEFKELARNIMSDIYERFDETGANAITIRHLQGAYISFDPVEGRTGDVDVMAFKSMDDLYDDETEQQDGTVEAETTVNTETNKTDSTVGNTVTIATPSNEKQFDAQYEVAEIGDVTASHDMNNRANDKFNDDKLQGRDRTHVDYEVKTLDQIKNFNPQFLGASVASDDGAPIITNSTSKVISGNGRHILLSRLYSRFPDKAAQYKQWLIDNAAQFGLSPDVIAKMDKPILVRRKSNDDDLELIADKSNVSGMAEMSALDRAFSDARQVSESVFLQFKGGELESFANQPFVRAFNDALNLGGSLTLSSLNRMKNAIMAHAYGDYGSAKGRAIVEGVSEELKPDAKSILNALYDSSSEWVLLRAAFVATGTKDFTNHLVDAVHLIRDARANGKEVKDMVDQYDMETMSSTDPFTRQFVQLFFKDTNMKTMIAQKDIAAILKDVATEMTKQISNWDMFDDAKPLTPQQILENAYARYKGAKSQPKGQVGLFDAGFSPFATRGDKQSEAESRKAESGQGTDSTGVKDEGREVTAKDFARKSLAEQHKSVELDESTEAVKRFVDMQQRQFKRDGVMVDKIDKNKILTRVLSGQFKRDSELWKAANAVQKQIKDSGYVIKKIGGAFKESVITSDSIFDILTKGNTNVPNTNTDLERNSGVTNVKDEGREVTPTYTNKSQARKHLQQVLKAKTEELVKRGELEIENNNWAQATFSSNKELREFMFDEALKVEGSGFGFSTTRFGKNLAADSMRDMVFNDVFGFRAKGAIEYVNHLETLAPIKGNTNVPSTNTDLERNSGVTNSANERNETPVFDGSTGDADLLGQSSEPVKSAENVANSDKLDSISIALTGGESSDNQLLDGNETNVIASSDARDSDSGRSGEDSINGMDAKRDGSNPIKELPAKSVKGLKPKQVTHVEADLENVKEAMPFLNEGQADDVVFAEKRFEEHKGVLFANGTGTGKTFSGLGIVSRFANQGKNNILIVAPSQNILDSWTKAAKNYFGLDVSLLEDKNDAGKGIVATTYANFGDNVALVNREWDLIVTDEAHYLMSNSAGTNTASLEKLRGLTGHEQGFENWFSAKYSDLVAEFKKVNDRNYLSGISDNVYYQERGEKEQHQKEVSIEYKDTREAAREEWKTKESKTKTVMLSATPFAYESNIDFANGYLFDYDKVDGSGYNSGGGKERFFMQHLGYRMRYNKLTQPDTKVDRSTMQRQFNEMLKKSGALSARSLDVPFDYDRQFILTESAIGQRIDEALQWLSDNEARELSSVINKKFDYLTRRYLLEAIKAKEIVPIVKEHLAAGRKILVVHDYKKGGTTNPFKLNIEYKGWTKTGTTDYDNENPENKLWEQYQEFERTFKDLISNELLNKMDSPIEIFQKEFKDVLIYNGDVSNKVLIQGVKDFNTDGSSVNLVLGQSDKMAEGVSFHDTTGVHQRVLINIGMPTKPTKAIQLEGRIYRVGQKSDAIFRYVNTGTNWERWAFASTIAGRASAAENLALGEGARGLRDAFINAFENSDSYPVGHEGEGKSGKDSDKQAYRQITEMDRAKGFYYATQKKNSRTKSAEGTDYFATPEPVGLVMTRLADAREGEKMLEPSAGHGAIARWFRTDAERTAIEPSSELNSRLALVFQDGDIKRQTFEDLNIINKYDAIVMNPPFGTGGKTAIEHLEKAFNHLRDGGRVVALIPEGAMADKRLDAFLNGDENSSIKPIAKTDKGDIYVGDTIVYLDNGKNGELVEKEFKVSHVDDRFIYGQKNTFTNKESAYLNHFRELKPTGARKNTSNKQLVADISLPTVTFERAGTKVKTHIVVIEKTSSNITTENVDLSDIDDINQLFDRLDALSIDERVKPVEEVAEKESAPIASNTTETVGTLVEGKHTKTGEAIFTVQLPARVERDTYTKWAAAAKQMGGSWSRFTNGFLFKSKDAADKFMDYLSSSDTSDVKLSTNSEAAPINTHTTASFMSAAKSILDNMNGKGWFDSLWGTGSFVNVSNDEALRIVEELSGAKFALVGDRSAANTQIDTTMGAYAAVARNLFAKIPNLKNILDYGAGKGRGTASVARALKNKSIDANVKSYEPFPENWAKSLTEEPDYTNADNIKDGSQDAVVNLNVLNVVPKAIRDDIVKNIGRVLKDGGIGVISSRRWKGDVDTIKPANSRAGEEPNSFYVTRKLKGEIQTNYQKGIEPDELVAYVQELLPNFDVRKINGYGASAVIIQKPNGTPLLDSILKSEKTQSKGTGSESTLELRKEANDLGAGERYSAFGVGKKMGDEVYLHRDYEDVLPQGDLADAKERIGDFEYNLIRYNAKTGAIGFFNSPDFDTSPEPVNGELMVVEPDGTIRNVPLNKDLDKQAIYHHKWQWVKDDYTGFDVAQSIERSIEWQKVVNREGINRKRIGFQGVWQNEVLNPFDIKYSKDGKIEAFYNPADDKVYFVPENISKERSLKGLFLHEVGTHMMRLGLNQEELNAIFSDVESKRESNPLVKAAYKEALRAGTKAQDLNEETLARVIDKHPELKLSQRFMAWFKKAVRNFAKRYKGADKLAFIKWANKLDEKDWVYMATIALKRAPSEVVFKGGTSDSDAKFSGDKKQLLAPNGNFDTNNNDIRFSKSNNESQGRFNIPNETSFQSFRKWVQDDLLRIRIVMDRVKEQGGIINESNDVALAMEAAGNIAANQLEKLKERHIQPLFDRMAKMKVNQDEIGLLLYAKSAPDRNAYIQSINAKFRELGEGGSGMTDAESAAIIERYKETMGDKYAEFEKLTDDWQNIQNMVKNILVASGDISPEQAQEWDNSTDYHVPLKGFEEIDEETGNKAKKSSRGNIGQGFSISGKFDRKMLGRQSRASNIVANIVQNLERAVIRSSKIYVQSTLYNLIKDNPDVDLWETDVTPMQPIMGKAKAQYVMTFHGSVIGQRDTLRDARRYVEAETERTGQSKKEYKIVKVGGNPQVTLMKKSYDQNTEISYWKNGKQVRITVNDEAFVQAFNRLGDENIYSMFKVMAAFNRFLRQAYTVLSPAFIIANGVMVDPAVGLYTNTARYGFKYAATVLAKTPMASLQLAKYMATGATSNTAWNTAIKLYLDNGGKSGTAFISSIENKADELNSAVLKSKMQNTNFYEYPLDRLKLLVVENKLANFLKYLGDVGETATRLATFKVAMDDGKSAQQAAKIARNVTINFNRRGILGRELGAMYLFLNASIQGTENLIDAAVRGEHKVQATALLATYVSIGYLIALLGGDDGDDDLISESEKTRFISVTLDEEKGIRANWKMAYGLSFFKDLGTAIARIQLGGDTEKIMNKLMSSFFNNFSYVNPMVSGEWDNRDLISGAIPTITNIPYSIYNNRNRWGKPIYPENVYDTSIPDSEKEWANTRGTLFSDFAKWMNKVTFGTKVEAGLIDVSPESMKYTLNALTGSIGTQSYKFVNSIYTSSINSTEMSVDKLPIVSSFIKETGIDAYRQVYNSQRKEAKEIYDKFKKYEKLDDEATTDKFVARHQSMLDFYDDTTSIIKRVKLLRTKQDDARLEGDRVLLKELESDEKELLIDYNAQYNQR